MKRALVLGGGGSKGAYELGVWRALDELGISFDIVTGTSIGAMIGAMYVQKQYEELGRSYYEKHKDEEGCEAAEQFFLIKEAVEEIERMKAEVLRIQGSAECPKCGAKMPEGAVYCSSCGTKMDDMYEEE